MNSINHTNTTIKSQGNKMKSINLKNIGTTGLSKEEIVNGADETGINHITFDSKAFQILIALTGDSYTPYRNIVDELNFSIKVLKAASKVGDKDSDNFIDEMEESLVQKQQIFSSIFADFSEEEMTAFNRSNQLECEEDTRTYLQFAIEEADSTYAYMDCAQFANNLLDEEEAVYALYYAAIMKYTDSSPISVLLEQSIMESNLSTVEKEELCLTLQRQVFSLK